jgi:hypothetical protein
LHLYVTNGAESVPKIVELARGHSASILTLSLSRPSLDDVFLKFTGSSLEDTGEESGDEWWKQWAGKGGGGKWRQQWSETQETPDNGAERRDHQDSQGGRQETSSYQPTSGADVQAGGAWPQQQWSAEQMAQWQGGREEKKDAPNQSESHQDKSADADRPSWPSRQDWPNDGGDDAWETQKKWPGNSSDK